MEMTFSNTFYWVKMIAFCLNITMTSQWARWRLKSPASRLLTQPCIQVQIKENIKAPRHSPLCGEFPAQRASNAEMFPFGDVIMNFHLYLEGVIDKSLHWFRQWLGAVKQQSHCLIPCQPISVTSLAPPSHTELTEADINASQTDNLSVTFPAISTWRQHCLCPHFSQTWSGGRNLPCNWNLVSCTTLNICVMTLYSVVFLLILIAALFDMSSKLWRFSVHTFIGNAKFLKCNYSPTRANFNSS